MSLASQIRLESSSRLLVLVMLVGAGGFVLGIATVLARFNADQTVSILITLLAGILLVSVIMAWRRMKPLGGIARTLRILEDGSIQLDAFHATSQKTLSVAARESNADETRHYQLAPGSLIWPGLFILRLKAINLHPGVDPENTKIISIVIFRHEVSEPHRHALARLLIWAQYKTQSGNPELVSITPSGLNH